MRKDRKILLPVVHLNGTSSDDLNEQVRGARVALREAIEALQKAAPNARDYYPHGTSAIYDAQREHQERLSKLEDVMSDLDQMMIHLIQ